MTYQTPRSNQEDLDFSSCLSRHTKIGFDANDIAALLNAIDSSQDASSPSHLPAEILLVILEYVPVDYILDWRQVCRGFRDAIDGRILYHHLRRVELIGYMGPRHARPMEHLNDEQYEEIHFLRARFATIDEPQRGAQSSGPVWRKSHATFHIDEGWYKAFRTLSGAAARVGHTVEAADTIWLPILDRLELRREEEGFGTLRWCLRLDHAVLDLDYPVEKGRGTFDVAVNLHKGTVWVAWRKMLVSFLKTERALRKKLEAKKNSKYTFSHAEDCLRYIRRQRLHSSLDFDNRIDRHIKWSLRLLAPLWGIARQDNTIVLADVEDDASKTLLLLRREAAMSTRQILHLHQLARDYNKMRAELTELDSAFGEFKRNLSMPGHGFGISLQHINPYEVAHNPIAWPDDVLSAIEGLVVKWKSQRKVIEQLQALIVASNVALTLPEDSFDHLDTDF
ncbi:hypothetical protein ACN47E_001974 [Coniothyrium glycines]